MSVRDAQQAVSVHRASASGRHHSDVVRVASALLLLLLCLLAVQRDSLTTFEADLFRLVNNLPAWMRPALILVMQVGNVVAAPVVAMAFLLRRRGRAAIDVLSAGLAAWVTAKLVKDWIGRPRPGGLLEDIDRLAGDAGRGFVSGHTAVAFAIATAAAAYLPRRWRRTVFVIAWAVGAARIYEGAHLPLDVVGGAALGWGLAALIHLGAGAPHRRPTAAAAAEALMRGGHLVEKATPLTREPRGSFPFLAKTASGPVFVKLLDPEARDHDLI